MKEWWKKFWKEFGREASIRAVRTIAQTAAALIGTGSVMSDVNWTQVLSASALSGILSLLMSLDRIGNSAGTAQTIEQEETT